MNYKRMMYLSFLLLVGLVSLWGCPKKTEMTSSPESQRESITAPAAPAPEVRSAESNPGMRSEVREERTERIAEGLKPVYFDFDKSYLRDDAKTVLRDNAAWLKAHPKVKVKIEGNCDERGTSEYNQALGQRRAASAKQYLATLGVPAGRIALISYGKEKPVCTGHDESCWEKNRKDDFAVMAN